MLTGSLTRRRLHEVSYPITMYEACWLRGQQACCCVSYCSASIFVQYCNVLYSVCELFDVHDYVDDAGKFTEDFGGLEPQNTPGTWRIECLKSRPDSPALGP